MKVDDYVRTKYGIAKIRSFETKNKEVINLDKEIMICNKELETYKLTFVDKLYFFFNDDYYKRYGYLFSKVEKHQKQWFREKNISFPYDFNKYLKNYTENLIFEFSSNYE